MVGFHPPRDVGFHAVVSIAIVVDDIHFFMEQFHLEFHLISPEPLILDEQALNALVKMPQMPGLHNVEIHNELVGFEIVPSKCVKDINKT